MLTPQGVQPKNLKYLFQARYKNGFVFNQTPADVSTEAEGKSAFYDVSMGIGCPPIEDMVMFSLVHENGDIWSVDLVTGQFLHNMVPFGVGDSLDQIIPEEYIEKVPFRVIYFRQHQVKTNITFKRGKEAGLNQIIDEKTIGHSMRYLLGFQFTFGGVNHKRMITIG